jgi:DNA end-binding protein Ku
MATPVWKGHLSFGLVAIPVKLYRAARADKVEFRQVHETTGSRVRQALYREPQEERFERAEPKLSKLSSTETQRSSQGAIPFRSPAVPVEVSRGELAKGYEYEPGRYLVLSREDIDSITPATAYQMQILEL